MKPVSQQIRDYDFIDHGAEGILDYYAFMQCKANEVELLEDELAEPKTIHLSRGLTVMISETDNYLCLQPRLKDRSRTAWEIWVTHTEERLRQNVSLRLITKGSSDEL